jgi:hypothetical protein
MTLPGAHQLVAPWSVGGEFLEAFANRDYRQMAATLAPDVRLRALLPTGPMDWRGADAVVEVFSSWFGGVKEFELVDAAIGDVAGRLHLSWRVRARPGPAGSGGGWHVVEQQAYLDADVTIRSVDLLCSGFRPQGPNHLR